jgi:hypothetical protein
MSPFAAALKNIFENSGFYDSVDEWKEYLGLKLHRLDQRHKYDEWLADKRLPSPSNLYMTYLIFAPDSIYTVPHPEAFEDFKNLLHVRATEVSPLGARMLPTVWEYMSRPLFCDLSNKLAKLNEEERVKLLLEMYP